jgi:hypothetical protein
MSASIDPVAAWRSLRPEITALNVREIDASRSEAIALLEAFIADNFGPGLTPTSFSRWDTSFSPTGFVVEQGFTSRHPVPPGMRYDSKTKHIVPAKRTDEGKAIAKKLDDLAWSKPFVDGLGGIVAGFNGNPDADRFDQQHYLLGWTFQVFTDAAGVEQVFAVLPVEHLSDNCDMTHWEKVPLSQYYAARESDAVARAARGEGEPT